MSPEKVFLKPIVCTFIINSLENISSHPQAAPKPGISCYLRSASVSLPFPLLGYSGNSLALIYSLGHDRKTRSKVKITFKMNLKGKSFTQ